MKPCLYCLFTVAALAGAVCADETVDFNREIRGILSENCLQCHGPDDKQRESNLRLDSKKGAFADLGGYLAFAPGEPDESEALRRMTSRDPAERMPPPGSGKKLTKDQIELIRRWIKQGAKWQDHWAFVPPERSALPRVSNASWVRNPIDRFVLARLEHERLAPSPAADRVTLLRRLSLDLIGLPPTIEEVDAFLADGRPDAYRRQVERLLASPHYGERWGRHWLDAARYADSDGFEKDKSRRVWFYRDWVVNSLNRDLPYDQFIIEQIAGDLLPEATQDQIVATGFLRNSMTNEEGGIDPEQFRMEAMFDRMDAIGKSVLGLTIQCAQCHTHKYDPLAQEEYYRMFAFLNDAHEANIAVYTPEEQMRRADIFRQIGQIEAELKHRNSDWLTRMTAWENRVTQNQPQWTVLKPTRKDVPRSGGQKHRLLDDGSILAEGYAPTKVTFTVSLKADLPNITAFRLELLNHRDLPLGGPGRSIKGTGALTEFRVEAAPANAPGKKTKVKIAEATADVNLDEKELDKAFHDRSNKRRVTGPVRYAVDGNDLTAWGIDAGPGRTNQPRKAVFTAEQPISHPGGTILTFHLVQKHGGWNSDDNQNHNLGRFRLSVTSTPDATADPLPKRVRDILGIPRKERTPAQVAAVFSYFRTTVPEWKEANERIEKLWEQHPAGSAQLVYQALAKPRETHVLDRGDFLRPTKPVRAGVPSLLHALPDHAPPTRLTFARWLVDRRSPTTARSIVNRVWQTYFGVGLVSTSEDLGLRSETPSHPELLDWLAVEFMDRGWRLKDLHRWIVTSATYRQSSHVTPALLARDRYNRLLARGPRFRVEGEIVRDIALAASGLLTRKLGGRSVYPPAPTFLFSPPASYGPKNWYEENGEERYRRALYTFRFRSVPYPVLDNFDTPNGDFSCVRRVRSNTPLQALTTLNEPLFVETARALARRVIEQGGDTDAVRLAYAFRCCVARTPSERESAVLLALLKKATDRFSQETASPGALTGQADKKPRTLPSGTTPAEFAAWTAVARVLLNLDETITKE